MTDTTQIPETIETQLRSLGLGQYVRQAQPVSDALVQREQGIVQALLDAAEESDIDTGDLIRTFEGLGMHLPEGSPDESAEELDETASVLSALVAFAQRNGYDGPVPSGK